MSKSVKNPLGRGLSSLLGENVNLDTLATLNKNRELKRVPIDSVSPGVWQVRKQFDKIDLKNLSNSIKENGIFQPILVITDKKDKNKYKIIAGERRWRAAQLARLHEIPVIIRDDLSDKKIIEISLLENLQRHDLNAIEEANGYLELIKKFSYTQEQVAKVFGKSRPYIANFLRLLNLPVQIKKFLIDGKISVGHARSIINSKNPVKIAKLIISKDLSVRQVEGHLRKELSPIKNKIENNYLDIENKISNKIGLKTNIKFNNKSKKGTITINFHNLDQLDFIIEKLDTF